MNSCSRNTQCNKIIEQMKGNHYIHIKEKGLVNTSNNNESNSNIPLFGENPTNQNNMNRRKFLYERIKKIFNILKNIRITRFHYEIF